MCVLYFPIHNVAITMIIESVTRISSCANMSIAIAVNITVIIFCNCQ